MTTGRDPNPVGPRTEAAVQRYVDREGLCRRYDISRATSYRYEKDGLIPKPVRLGPGILRWAVVELEAFERRAAEDRP